MRIATLIAILAFFGAAAYAGSEQKFEPDTICASIWKPVCASNGTSQKTFPNQCIAETSGYSVVSHSECGSKSGRMLPLCGNTTKCEGASPAETGTFVPVARLSRGISQQSLWRRVGALVLHRIREGASAATP